MSDWPLASTQAEPPTPEERYQTFISYANSAGLMRQFYEEAMRTAFARQGITGNPQLLRQEDRQAAVDRFLREETEIHFTCFHYWLGSLFILVEGWSELHLVDPAIDTLLRNKTNCDLLRRVRHATFHYQRSLRVNQFAEFYQEIDTVGPWALVLHDAFGRFLTMHPTRPN